MKISLSITDTYLTLIVTAAGIIIIIRLIIIAIITTTGCIVIITILFRIFNISISDVSGLVQASMIKVLQSSLFSDNWISSLLVICCFVAKVLRLSIYDVLYLPSILPQSTSCTIVSFLFVCPINFFIFSDCFHQRALHICKLQYFFIGLSFFPGNFQYNHLYNHCLQVRNCIVV